MIDVDDDDDDDDVEPFRKPSAVQMEGRYHLIWGGEEGVRGGGGGESLSPGRSGIRGPAHPLASQSKTQGSPLGGYLS